MLQPIITMTLLSSIMILSRMFFRFKAEWMGPIKKKDWGPLRAVIVLNHTSLYEPLLAGFGNLRLMWRFARHGVLPIAEKTMRRKVGLFFRFLVRHPMVITRQRDQTWDKVLNQIDDQSIVIILPEGRMKRADGLDSTGKPMTVRAGIADILGPLHEGRILLVYSGGLHHIQVPGESRWPRLFKTIHGRFEIMEIQDYKAQLGAGPEPADFKRALVADLTARRDKHCPALERITRG